MPHWSRSLHGWEFSLDDCDCGPGSSCRGWWCEVRSKLGLKRQGAVKPNFTFDHAFSITHLGSGLQFRFKACDALRKWSWEKFKYAEGYYLPTYGSPLLPVGLDSAYVGRLLIPPKPGGIPWNIINSVWEDIDWETLHKQVVWTKKHGKISGKTDGDFFSEKPKREAERVPNRKLKGKTFKGKVLHDTLVNSRLLLYMRIPSRLDGDTLCSIDLAQKGIKRNKIKRWWCEVRSKLGLKRQGAVKPNFTFGHAFSITHLGSGLQFRFKACDALRKWSWEKFKYAEGYYLPTYGSPLLPVGLDSAYVGRLLIPPKPGGIPWNIINSVWEDIDWETLHKQVVWTKKHGKISGKTDGDFFSEKPKREAERVPNRKLKGKTFKGKVLHDTLVNSRLLLYMRIPSRLDGDTLCSIDLVLTESGWFFALCQHFFGRSGVKRTREMTMHCSFEEDIVYREIIERQSKDFQERLDQPPEWPRVCEADDGMHLHFHEVKQLVVKGAFERAVYGSSVVHDTARRYSSFVCSELYRETDGKIVEKSDVLYRQIESLFSNSGEQIELISKETGTCIQIVPLFPHPQDPRLNKVRREAYIYGPSKYNVDCAKSRIAYLLEGMEIKRKRKTKAERKAERRAIDGSLSRVPSMDEVLPDIAAIFGEA